MQEIMPVSSYYNYGRFKRTRLAPTPSGFLHLGNLFSFACTAALAQQTGAKLLLRIDDLDQGRTRQEYVSDVFDTLAFMRLPWHEGPSDALEFYRSYSQLERMHLYNDALAELVKLGLVYACSCSRTDLINHQRYPGTCKEKNLPLYEENLSWRLHTGPFPEVAIKGLSAEESCLLPETMHDFVVRKKDGSPSYQLASLIDDDHFDVDLIVRGQDLYPSSIAQLYLASVLAKDRFLNCTFVHHRLLSSPAGSKLSKSAGDTSVRFWRQKGLSAADIYELVGKLLGRADIRHWNDLLTEL